MLDITTASRTIERYLDGRVDLDRVNLNMIYSNTRGVWWCIVTRYDGKPLGKLYLDTFGKPTFDNHDIGRIVNEYRKP